MRTLLVIVGFIVTNLVFLAVSTSNVHALPTVYPLDRLLQNAAGSTIAGQLVRANHDASETKEGDSRFHDGSFVYVPKAIPEPESELFYGGSFKYKSPPVSKVAGAPAVEPTQTNISATSTYAATTNASTTAGTNPAPTATPVAPLSPVTFTTQSTNQIPATSAQRDAPYDESSANEQYSTQYSDMALSVVTGKAEATVTAKVHFVTQEQPATDVFYAGDFILMASEQTQLTYDTRFYGDTFILDSTTNRLRPARAGGLVPGSQILSMPVRASVVEAELTPPLDFAQHEAPKVVETVTDSATYVSDTMPVVEPAATAAVTLGMESVLPTYYERSELPLTGKAMYYNPGIMQYVLNYRLDLAQVEQCPECVGYVALLRAGDLNRRVWIDWPDTGVEGPYLVIDVAAQHHISMLLSRGWVVDVDYRTAMRHGMYNPVTVTVLAHPDGGAALK